MAVFDSMRAALAGTLLARTWTGGCLACGIGLSWVLGLACLPTQVVGQITSVTWEVDTTFYEPAPLPGSTPGSPQYNFDSNGALTGYTTYKFYANFASATDRLSSVYALSSGPNMQFNAPAVATTRRSTASFSAVSSIRFFTRWCLS